MTSYIRALAYGYTGTVSMVWVTNSDKIGLFSYSYVTNFRGFWTRRRCWRRKPLYYYCKWNRNSCLRLDDTGIINETVEYERHLVTRAGKFWQFLCGKLIILTEKFDSRFVDPLHSEPELQWSTMCKKIEHGCRRTFVNMNNQTNMNKNKGPGMTNEENSINRIHAGIKSNNDNLKLLETATRTTAVSNVVIGLARIWANLTKLKGWRYSSQRTLMLVWRNAIVRCQNNPQGEEYTQP